MLRASILFSRQKLNIGNIHFPEDRYIHWSSTELDVRVGNRHDRPSNAELWTKEIRETSTRSGGRRLYR